MNFKGKISNADMEEANRIKNPPTYEPGFEPEEEDSGGMIFDDIDFDNFDIESENTSSDNSFIDSYVSGNNVGSIDSGMNTPSAMSTVFGDEFLKQQPEQKDLFDKTLAASSEAAKSLFSIISSIAKSVKTKNAQEIGKLCKNIIVTSTIFAAIAIAVGFIGIAVKIDSISFIRLPADMLLGAGLSIIVGFGGMVVSALRIVNGNGGAGNNYREQENIYGSDGNYLSIDENEDEESVDFVNPYNFGDISDSDDDGESEEDKVNRIIDDFISGTDSIQVTSTKEKEYNTENIDKVLEEISNRGDITRKYLVDTMIKILPTSTDDFSEAKPISPASEEFQTLDAICLKALARAAKKEMHEVGQGIEEASETIFSYILKVHRGRVSVKVEDYQRELEAYMKDDEDNANISVAVKLEGDFYSVEVIKGKRNIVTLGDVLKKQEYYEFFVEERNLLPVCLGITLSGKAILQDCKKVDSILIAGKPRMGKSWYSLGVFGEAAIFNLPELVQMIIIDPKDSALLNTISLMPHVCGYFDASKAIQVLTDIIEKEAPRRKKLLKDHMCDTYIELRERYNIILPTLYIFIDEVISVKVKLGETGGKQFMDLMTVILTQFPYLGIKLMLVPHRAKGIVDKTLRTNIGLSAVACGTQEVILETLDVKRFDRELLEPGDIAVTSTSMPKPMFVRGACLGTNDIEHKEVFIKAAKIFYKLGVRIPDMSTLGMANNLTVEYKKKMLAKISGENEFKS